MASFDDHVIGRTDLDWSTDWTAKKGKTYLQQSETNPKQTRMFHVNS